MIPSHRSGPTPGKAREASSKRRRRFPEGCHTHCLKTDETTELEPGKLESRWYAPGVGLIRDDTRELVYSEF